MQVQKYLAIILTLLLLMASYCSNTTTGPELDPNKVTFPIFNPSGGPYESAQSVSIKCATRGATIHYTTDGTDPTADSEVYSSPISISSSSIIKAIGYKEGLTPSNLSSGSFTIGAHAGELAYVPGGTFIMGDTSGTAWVGFGEELPLHSVTLNAFYMGKYLVTQGEYAAVMGSNPAHSYGVGDNYPVYLVSWYSALKYCNLRSMEEGLTPVYTIRGSTDPSAWGRVPSSDNSTWNAVICDWTATGYRLPTEAEWEYAARGATNDPDYVYSGTNNLGTVGWYDNNNHSDSPYGIKPVGTKAPNALGLYDMSGNVFEWCWDWLDYRYYNSSPISNPTGPDSGTHRVDRGGNWLGLSVYCRVSSRQSGLPKRSYGSVGFRICRAGL
ncbi:MAG: SUMF1/EgtB/PvdO family nonheme iron enzyme [Candidatus Cloacimonadaceae bacterium]|nr:SUMF1/EgtB/PvdO family nonheme iron enzyme [Candidatus Cloacimonadota bacterium]